MRFINKKELLSCFFGNAFVIALSRLFSSTKNKGIPVLAYHRISQDNDGGLLSNSGSQLISATRGQFLKQMRYLSKNGYQTVLFSDLDDKNCILPERPVIITFDDGFSDNYDIASKVLEEFGFKAVFFISTDYIGSGDYYWFDKLLTYQDYDANIQVITKTLLEYDSDIENKNVIEILKDKPNESRLHLLDKINANISENDSRPVNNLTYNCLPMTWNQVIELSSHGHEIGSHSKTHPMLSRCGYQEQVDEIEGSRKEIEAHIGKKVCVFSYPFGGRDSYSNDVIDILKASGYKYACNYLSGMYFPSANNTYEISRLHIEQEISFRRFKALLEFSKIISYREI